MPAPELGADLSRLAGDILILGVGGKMGPTLARLAKRAAPGKRVVGVARFTEPGLREKLEAWGVECIACDLLDRGEIERLPRIENVVFMAGRKFGSSGREDLTWAMNVMVPAQVAEAFGRHLLAQRPSGPFRHGRRRAKRALHPASGRVVPPRRCGGAPARSRTRLRAHEATARSSWNHSVKTKSSYE